MFLIFSVVWLLVATVTASVQLKTDLFKKDQFPLCFLHLTKTVFAKDKLQCLLMCKSGCQFSMFNHSTGACNLYTDGDTSECDDTTDDHQYVYRKESQTYVHVVPNTKGINWFDAQRVCLALGGRFSGYTASTSHDDVVASLGDNACWLGARKLSSGWSWLSGASVTASLLNDQNATCLLYYRIPNYPINLHDHPCDELIPFNQIRCDLY